MKHINRFNEGVRSHQFSDIEEIEDEFFKFLEEARNLGSFADSELSHSDGVDSKKLALDAVSNYGQILESVTKQFKKFESLVNELLIV